MIKKHNPNIKTIIKQFFDLEEQFLPNWLNPVVINNTAKIKSYLWKSNFCSKIRLCELLIDNKFYAQSLVIYPDLTLNSPIFGTEYISVPEKRYFGAIDFHPVGDSNHYLSHLEMFPDTKIKISKYYDLNKFFSKKFWVKKQNKDFYEEYLVWLKCYLHQYKKCLTESKFCSNSFGKMHQKYNQHMSNNDPAFGILKSYFDTEFAEKYIHQFLFDNT